MSERFKVSVSTVKRRLERMDRGQVPLVAHDVVVLMDTTYWGRDFGVVVLMDASDSRVLWFKFIYRKERLDDYREGLDCLKASGMEVKAVVSDGFTGLREMLRGVPYQMCHFHQLQRIRQLLTNRPKLPASVELKEIASALATSDKERFRAMLEDWHVRWKEFLKERTVTDNGRSFFTHRRTRSAYYTASKHIWTSCSPVRAFRTELCLTQTTLSNRSILPLRLNSEITEGFPSREGSCLLLTYYACTTPIDKGRINDFRSIKEP